MSTSKLTPDQIGEIFTAGVARDLEAILKEKLHRELDHIIDDFAIDLAKQIAVRVQSIEQFDINSLSPKLLMNVLIDRKQIAQVEMVPHVKNS